MLSVALILLPEVQPFFAVGTAQLLKLVGIAVRSRQVVNVMDPAAGDWVDHRIWCGIASGGVFAQIRLTQCEWLSAHLRFCQCVKP